jgi:glycosyltransferase 2 family protein
MVDPLQPPPRPRRLDLRRAELWIVVAVIVFIAGFAITAALVGGEQVLANLGKLGWPMVLGMLGLSLVNYGLRAARWMIYSRHIGVDVPLGANLLYYMTGFALTTTPSKIGETLRHWLLERGHGYAYSRTLPLWVADRLNDVTASLVLILVGLVAFSEYLWQVGVFLALFAGFMGLIVRPKLLLGVITWVYGRIRRKGRVFAGFRRAVRFSSELFTARLYLIGVGLAAVGWLAECLAFWWLLREMGAPVSLGAAIFIFSFSLLFGGVSLTPGGLGGFEASMIFLLNQEGISLDVAVAATAVIRAVTLWFSVAIGFCCMPFALHRVRRPVGKDERKKRAQELRSARRK